MGEHQESESELENETPAEWEERVRAGERERLAIYLAACAPDTLLRADHLITWLRAGGGEIS